MKMKKIILAALLLTATIRGFSQEVVINPPAVNTILYVGTVPAYNGSSLLSYPSVQAAVTSACAGAAAGYLIEVLPGTYATDAITSATGGCTKANVVDFRTPSLNMYPIYQWSGSAYVTIAPISNAISSATGGSGSGTVTCLTASCTNLRGTYSVAGGTFTTGNFLTLVWPTTTTAYVCTVTQNGGATIFGIGNSVATATGMNVTAAISVAASTVIISYTCQP